MPKISKKSLLVLGAGRLNIPALREMSKVVSVVALDKNPHSLINESQLKICECDFSDQDKLLNFVENQEFQGVYPMNDHAIMPAANVAKKLGLEAIDYATSEALLDKSKMRMIWHENHLSQPKYEIVKCLEDAHSAADHIGYPLIIKPSASGGAGRGVYRVNSADELNFYYPSVLTECRYSSTILVEEFVDGLESSMEIVFLNKKAHLLAISSKVKAKGSSQVATEIVYPAQISKQNLSDIFSLVESAGLSLGISNGIGHFEVITNSCGVPHLVEVGGRAGGGHTFHPIVSHVSGINYPQLIAHLFSGNFHEVESLLQFEIQSNAAVYSFPVTEQSGSIEKIGFNNLPSESCIAECWRKKGDFIDGMNSSMDRLGCLVVLSDKGVSDAIEESRIIMSDFLLELN